MTSDGMKASFDLAAIVSLSQNRIVLRVRDIDTDLDSALGAAKVSGPLAVVFVPAGDFHRVSRRQYEVHAAPLTGLGHGSATAVPSGCQVVVSRSRIGEVPIGGLRVLGVGVGEPLRRVGDRQGPPFSRRQEERRVRQSTMPSRVGASSLPCGRAGRYAAAPPVHNARDVFRKSDEGRDGTELLRMRYSLLPIPRWESANMKVASMVYSSRSGHVR